ncbi:MAG TPA: alkaline phosphatase family protein, partial [Anaerolineae bacterium]|nr:alkaline phosphatase family protein [Anaerolineae bacterium]
MKSPKKVLLIGFDGANPELLRSYVKQGELPHFARLMERGVFTVALPSVPANTPVNWTSIATGAHPGTHGITDYWVHFPGDPLDGFKEMFRSDMVQAEQLWTTAERSGRRALTMHYPGAHPWTLEKSLFVGGEGAPESGSRFELKSGTCFVSPAAQPGTRKATVVTFGGDPPRARLELVPTRGASPMGVAYEALLLGDCVEIRDWAGQ